MVWSFVYLALHRLLELLVLCRSTDAKEVEILVLRHQLAPTPQGPGPIPRAADIGPSVVSVVPIARFASHPGRGRSRIGTAAPPADYVVRNSGRASAGISLHFPSA